MAIQVLKDKCIGCRLCVKSCPFNAIDMDGKLAVINEKCTACKQCIDACKLAAIINTGVESAVDLSAYKNVWVYAEQRNGKLMNAALELIGEGRRLSRETGDAKIYAVLAGDGIAALPQECFEYGADGAVIIEAPLLKQYTTGAYTKALYGAVEAYKPEIMLFGATHIGRALAPRLAARLNTGLTADCTRLDIRTSSYIEYARKNTTLDISGLDPNDPDTGLKQTRPAFGGNLMATIICPRTRPQMATVRPGVMTKRERQAGAQGEIIRLTPEITKSDIRTAVVETVKAAKELVSLTDADIICSGGRGLGNASGFELIQRFAEKTGGVVGASRAAVDAGWIDHAHQVGQTGTTVKPKVYFACGISGAIQHLAGMQNAGVIVAINKDPAAPIFEAADFGITGDLYEIIPQIIEEWDRAGDLYEASVRA